MVLLSGDPMISNIKAIVLWNYGLAPRRSGVGLVAGSLIEGDDGADHGIGGTARGVEDGRVVSWIAPGLFSKDVPRSERVTRLTPNDMMNLPFSANIAKKRNPAKNPTKGLPC